MIVLWSIIFPGTVVNTAIFVLLHFHYKHTDMKNLKFWMAGFIFASLVAVAALNVNMNYHASDCEEITFINVEALAQSEGGMGDCVGIGSVTCGDREVKAIYTR